MQSTFTLAQIHAHRERYARRRMACLSRSPLVSWHAYLKAAHEARRHADAIEKLCHPGGT